MPTPFMHLQTAEKILAAVPNGRFRTLLTQQWPAFYLGSVAPDYQTICDVPREVSHFYTFPPDPAIQAHAELLAKHPELVQVVNLPPEQSVFVAAYMAHLMLDLVWFWEIVLPFFVQAGKWGSRETRQLVHFILLTHLDTLALESLPQTAVSTLAAAHPQHWLPFAADDHLIRWRDMLVEQLHPGAPIQTVEIYAGRMGMTSAEFATHLHDPAWMQEHLFDNIPVDKVQAVLETAVPRSIDLITNYLGYE